MLAAMVRAAESLERQLQHYEAESDRLRATDDAAARAEAQEVVAYANFVYDRIRHVDEEWSADLASRGETPSDADARAVWDLYARWCGKAEADLRRAAALDAKGHRIAGLDRFRQAYYEVRDVLSVAPDRLRRSTESANHGRTRPLSEIRDELRRELNP